MFTEKDTFRFDIEKYLKQHGPRRCAFFLFLFMQNKIMNDRGVLEMAARLNLHLTGILPIDVMYRYIFDGWRVQYVQWHPKKLRCFEVVQRMADLLLNEKDILAQEKESYFFEKIDFIENHGAAYDFAMEFCMPSTAMIYYQENKTDIEMISHFSVVDEEVVEKRQKIENLNETILNEIKKDFESYTNLTIEYCIGQTPAGYSLV